MESFKEFLRESHLPKGTKVKAGDETLTVKKSIGDDKYVVQEKLDSALAEVCWKGYEMVGTKIKDGKPVPNCVPKQKPVEEEAISEISQKVKDSYVAKAKSSVKDLDSKISDKEKEADSAKSGMDWNKASSEANKLSFKKFRRENAIKKAEGKNK